MPDNPTNRERLLRLIDGGAEALKDVHTEETAPARPVVPKSPSGSTPPEKVISGLKNLPSISEHQRSRIAQGTLAALALGAALYYGWGFLKTMHPAKPAVQAAAVSAPVTSTVAPLSDESGTGLRLVGVDSSDPSPVALLEDLKTGKTYFARVNERVKDAQVKAIEKNKVTVSIHGKTVELR